MSGFVAGPDQVGDRLDVALAQALGLTRSRAAARIEAGEVTVDGVEATKRHRLRDGQRVEVAEPAAVTAAPAPPLPPVRFEDDDLLVVAKPAGLVVHPGHGNASGTLVDALRAAGIPLAAGPEPDRPGVVHRLDRDTSGLMVVAKTAAARAGLVSALRDRDVTRRYLALVEGRPAAERGRIDGPIGRDPRDRTRFAVVADGKAAMTRYRVIAVGDARLDDPPVEVALLACELATGRTHQIRVHLSTLGHPLVGDPAYRGSRRVARALEVDRPALHAAHLAFTHPVTGEEVAVDEPLPGDLAAALGRAGIPVPAPSETS